jgi:tRNA pseudouridine13 synthase
MKVKQHPEDFHVEELTDVTPTSEGNYAFYRLTKKSLGTPEALQRLCQGLRLAPPRVSYGGLKDTHAHTLQHITIAHGPRRNWNKPPLTLEYLGQVSEPFQAQHIRANRFTILLRDFSSDTLTAALRELPQAAESGVANYFDDQRFGSVSTTGEFVARRLMAEEYEEALQLALCAHYSHDRSAVRKNKHLLRSGWGDWSRLKPLLPHGPAQRVVAYLAAKPQDFRGAVLQLPHPLLTLYLSAYQSHLWNKMLQRWFTQQFAAERLLTVKQKSGTILMPKTLTPAERDRLLTTEMPLPSARLKLEEDSPWHTLIADIMAEEGVPLAAMKFKHLREIFFSKGERAVWFLPQDFTWQSQPGEKPHRHHLRLQFTLPRGCYATMLIKRITAVERTG